MRKSVVVYMISALLMVVSGCQKEELTGIDGIVNPIEGKQVYYKGQTVTVSFEAEGPWTACLKFKDSEGWAEITNERGNDKAGKGSVRVDFKENDTDAERSVGLYVTVTGMSETCVCRFVQAAQAESSAMSRHLNEYMDRILSEDYLWDDEYRALKRDMEVSYDEFLWTHLSQLGETNIEDGGYYRAYSANHGDRYIYSYIQEVTSSDSKAPVSLPQVHGLGIGPLFASPTGEGDNIYLTVGYVYRGSPAEETETRPGLRKGDNIYAVAKGNSEPVTITRANYQSYMKELFSSASGTYTILFARYEPPVDEGPYVLNPNNAVTVTAGNYGYDPVLYAAYMKKDDITTSEQTSHWPDFCIGYLAMESFDLAAHEVLIDQLAQFKQAGITDLILDFSFNVGGAVAQARYLASAIVGPEHYDDVFFKPLFNDGRTETWTFRGGPDNSDGLGVAEDLGLERVWMIVSENTASASELIIHALRYINYPLVIIGSRTEGKNVGMEVSYVSYKGREFEFAPITYWGLNGNDEKAPADGFLPEGNNLLNNQNESYDDDVVDVFPYTVGDWGNFDFNWPFYFLFCDIVGDPRPEYAYGDGQEGDAASVRRRAAARVMQNTGLLESTGVRHAPGRCGTIIYRDR